jgi:N-acyl homoserine lactone hydrolase
MKMHVLDLGRLTLDRNLMVSGSSIATAENPHAPNERMDIPVSSYCIEHPEGNVLFDLGCNPNAMGPEGRWPEFLQQLCPHTGGEECDLPNRLEQIGLGPDDIRYAVLSHLHNDHSGCVEYFKTTKLIVHRAEFDLTLRTFGLRNHFTPYVLNDVAAWTQTDLDWHLLDSDEPEIQLVPGVDILNLGSGHSAGMLGLKVQTKELGTVILASDSIYQAANFGPPATLPGVVYDPLGMARITERIRNLATRTKGHVWFGHDPDQFATLRKSTDGYYE